MSDINSLLSEFWKGDGTKVAAAQAEFAGRGEKVAAQAQAELFMKMAADENIDVNALLKAGQTDVVDQLWSNFQGLLQKQASEEPDERKKKEEEAKEEHAEKKAMAEKLALADLQGRVMAHSYVQELGNIANNGEVNKTAAALAGAEKSKEARYIETVEGAGKALVHSGAHGGAMTASLGHRARNAAHSAGEAIKKHAPMAGAAAAGVAAGAGGHALASHKKEEKKEGSAKAASAIDQLAAECAVFKVASWVEKQGGNQEQIMASVNEAAEKIAAADTLNMFNEGSVKVAAAPDWETAVDWRACEMLERVGYPISWPDA